jgi:hypothetical protein
LALLLLAARRADSHDWKELERQQLRVEQLAAVVGVAEEVQGEVPAERVSPLAADGLAVDWANWLTAAARLDRRDGLADLADRMIAAGVVPEAARDLAIEAWRHALEHLTLAWDARELAVTRDQAGRAEARLTDPGLADEEAVRLSYVAWLGRMETPAEHIPEALLDRLGALIEAARQTAEQP